MLATKRQATEVYRRAEHGWAFEAYGPDDALHLTGLGVELAMATLYRRTEALAETEESDGEV